MNKADQELTVDNLSNEAVNRIISKYFDVWFGELDMDNDLPDKECRKAFCERYGTKEASPLFMMFLGFWGGFGKGLEFMGVEEEQPDVDKQ